MQKLFGKAKQTISEHIQNVFKEGELEQDSVVRNFRTTAEEKWESQEEMKYNRYIEAQVWDDSVIRNIKKKSNIG